MVYHAVSPFLGVRPLWVSLFHPVTFCLGLSLKSVPRASLRSRAESKLFVAVRDSNLAEVGLDDVPSGFRALAISSFEMQVPRDLRLMLKIGGKKTAFMLTNLDDVRSLRRVLDENDVAVCALLLTNNFGAGDLDSEIGYVVASCEAGKKIGSTVARIDPTVGERHALSPGEQGALAAGPIKQVLSKVEDIELAMENHGPIANTREFIDALFRSVSSSRVGLTLDPANFYWFGHPLSEVMQIVRDYGDNVKHTHMKNGRAPEGLKEERRKLGNIEMTPIYKGDIPLGEVVSILRKAGYKRDLTVEDESIAGLGQEEGREILRRDVEHLRSMIE